MDEVRSRTYKHRDSWWTVLLVDPFAGRLVRIAARTSVTPNQLSVGALVIGLGAAGCFWRGTWPWLVAGALIYHVAFVLDCVDGKLARLKGIESAFGGWLDYVFDRVRVLICTLALVAGQFLATGRAGYLYLGIAIVFLDMLRYLNSLKINAVRQEMLDRLRIARADDGDAPRDLQQGFHGRFSWYARVRDGFARRRIRPHLVSGIEFQMAVFIVGPLTNALIPVTVTAAALMLAFETAMIYKLWLSSKDFTRNLNDLEGSHPPVRLSNGFDAGQ